MGTVIQMAGTSVGGPESSIAAIDVPQAGSIVGVSWAVTSFYDTALDAQEWQLSFGSVANFLNDSRQIISSYSSGALVVLSAVGGVVAGGNFHDPLPDVSVAGGERIFLHCAGSAGVVGTVRVKVHFDFEIGRISARRR